MGLILETMNEPFTHVVFFFQFVCEKVRIFTSVLNERQTLELASYYNLALVFGTLTERFTQVAFFFQFIAKRIHICILVKHEYI